MMCSRAALVGLLLSVTLVISVQCGRIPANILVYTDGEKSNQTKPERLNALTGCLEETGYPIETIHGLQDLFEEVDGRTDGYYLVRAAEFIGEDYLRGRRCVCQGIYSSVDLKEAKHCFNKDDEWSFIMDLCFASRKQKKSPEYLPKACGVLSLKQLRDCCKHPELMD